MKTTRFRYYLDYEQEEKWVNDMAAQGWHLQKFFLGVFIFEKGEPGKYIYRNEFLSDKKKDYLTFLKTLDIDCVHKFGGWAYYRQEATVGDFELYTDLPSKLKYLTNMYQLFNLLFIFNILAGIMNISFGLQNMAMSEFSFGIGTMSIIISLILLVPILKVKRRRKTLKESMTIFEA